MTKIAANRKPETVEETIPSGGSIDQIREILFGSAQREHDIRAAQLEKLIERRTKEMVERVAKAQGALERKLEKTESETSASMDRIIERLDQIEAAAKKDNAATMRDLSEKIAQLDDRMTENIQAQDDSLRERIEALHDDLTAAIQRLEQEKTGNANLGDWLMEVGLRLKGDSTLGSIESSLSEMLGTKPVEKT